MDGEAEAVRHQVRPPDGRARRPAASPGTALDDPSRPKKAPRAQQQAKEAGHPADVAVAQAAHPCRCGVVPGRRRHAVRRGAPRLLPVRASEYLVVAGRSWSVERVVHGEDIEERLEGERAGQFARADEC
eukprot:1261492-Pyramimonas_sp.AAC.1